MPTSKASADLLWYHDKSIQMNRRVRICVHGGVVWKAREGLSMPISKALGCRARKHLHLSLRDTTMSTNSSSPLWAFNLYDLTAGIPRLLAEGIHSRVFPGENTMLSIVRFEPQSFGQMHSHPEEQWGLLLEGECTRLQGHEVVLMKPGDFWHTPGGTPHCIHTGDKCATVLDIFSPPRPEYLQAGNGFGLSRA